MPLCDSSDIVVGTILARTQFESTLVKGRPA